MVPLFDNLQIFRENLLLHEKNIFRISRLQFQLYQFFEFVKSNKFLIVF